MWCYSSANRPLLSPLPLAPSPPPFSRPPLQKEKERCKDFLLSFRTPPLGEKDAGGEATYVNLIGSIATGAETRFRIELSDVTLHDPSLAVSIAQNARRYADLFSAAIDELMPEPSREVTDHSTLQDVLRAARLNRLDANPEAAGADPARFFPPRLLRNYEVRFAPAQAALDKPLRLRDIGSTHIGKFVTAECMVIRASDVKPQIDVAAYTW